MRIIIVSCLIISTVLMSCDEPATNAQAEQTEAQVQQESTTTVEDNTETEEVEDATTTDSIPQNEITSNIARPVLSFESKSFDYGTVAQGDKVTHTFRFTNEGDAELIIKKASASCGCTMPSYPFVPIKPGESGAISVTFNTTGKMGKQRPNITVTSNAYPSTQTLYLEGYVTDGIAAKPNSLIEEGIYINPEDNVTKGGSPVGEIKGDTVKPKKVSDDN